MPFLNKIFLGGVIIISVFITKFPTLYHWLNPQKGFFFVKQASWFDAWDVNAYVSYIRYGENHGMLLQNTYTSIPHKGIFIFQFYTFLGLLNRIFRLDPFIVFHLSSAIIDIFLVIAVYKLVKLFIEETRDRIPVLILLVFGGGLGFISGLIPFSADIYTPDFTFLKPLSIGHDGLSILLSLLSIYFFYKFAVTEKNPGNLFPAVLTGIGTAVFHPYKLLWLVIIGFVTAVWQRKLFRQVIKYPLFLILLFCLYFPFSFYPFLTSPGFSGIARESFTAIDVFAIVSGLGLLSPLLFWQLFISRDTDKRIVFLKIVFLTQTILLFLPLSFARQFIPTIYVWAGFLTYFSLKELFKNRVKDDFKFTLWGIVFISTLTAIYVFTSVLQVQTNNQYYYLTRNEALAFDALNKMPGGSVVLSLYRMGNYIPAFTADKVYFGHFYQTPNSTQALNNARLFYTKMDENKQKEFLKNNSIDYVYYGLEEMALRREASLSSENPFPNFPSIYQNDNVVIFKPF